MIDDSGKIEAEQNYKEIWEPIFTNENGDIDKEKLKAEMIDLIFVFNQISQVYMHLTGGLLSKPMYYADTITSKHDELCQEAYEKGYDEGYQQAKDDIVQG